MISEKTLDHPILTLMVFTLLGLVGIFTLGNTAIDLMPDVDMPYIMVSASYENAGPESVEKSVTTLIEDALSSLSNLNKITSTSSEGRCSVLLEFTYGTDLEVATNDIRDKLDRITRSLPDDVTPTIFKMNASSMPIMRIAVRGNRSPEDLKKIADDNIVDVLEQANGVGEASTVGGREQIVRVELEQNRLQAYDLTLTSVSSALSKQNLEIGGGTITEGTMDYSIRTVGEYTDINEINDTVIVTKNGYDVKLSDIGRAFMGYKDATSSVYINGVPGVYISITKQSGENSVTVANAVYKKIEELQKTLPTDISLEIIRDDTDSIRDTLSTLIDSAWQGLVLAVIILFIFLCAIKTTIIIAISIPLSIIITLFCMNMAGITLNMMTLTGLILGVGMIVDASVVIIENIYSYRIRGAKPRIAAILGSSEMIASVVSGNLTTICVFIPFLFFIKDLDFMGQMFKGIIFTIVISLVSSLFVAIFLVPVLAGHFFPLTNRNEKPVKSKFFRGMYSLFGRMQAAVEKAYGRALKKALQNRGATVAICVSVLIFALMLAPTLRVQMMTGGHDDSVTVNLTLPVGTSIEETTAMVLNFQEIVEREIQGYKYLITSIGSTGRSGSSYNASIQISLPDSSEQIDNDETIKTKLRKYFNDYTDVTFAFGQGRRQQMTGSDIDIVLRSSSLTSAMSVANQISDVMKTISDLGEPSIDTEEGLPQVQIEIDRQRAYNFGVNVSTVANEINACIEGTSSTVFRKDGDDYTVYVMLRPEDRSKVLDLEQIFVSGTNGLISVSNFAKTVKSLGPVQISRENRNRIVHITADIVSEENANVVEEKIKDGIANSFVVPDNVSVSYEGSWKDINEQGGIFLKIALMAIILVFGVMAATYENFKAPFINLMTIPFLIIGVVFIYKITGQAFSIVSAVGIIMLVGIVVNNGIILVDYTNLLMDRGIPKDEACYRAGCSRIRPVLMTTLTTILGMIPMCFASSGSAGMVQPIGVAVVGGLTSSTFVTLFFIPVLYSLVMKEKKSGDSNIKVEFSAEQNSSEENSANENSAEQNSSDKNSADENFAEKNSAEKNSAEQNSSDKNSADKNSADENSAEQNSSDKNSAEQISADKNSADKNSANKNSADKNSADENSAEQNSSDKNSAEQISADKNSADKNSANKNSADKNSADENSAEQNSSDKNSAEQISADKNSADKNSANKNSAEQISADENSADKKTEA
jgi:HAE1 family hydrophobic/amphiphilic exporter-1